MTVDGVTVQTSENGESTTMGMESETSASPTATSAVPGPVASGTPRMDTRPLLAKVEGMGAVWHTVSVKFQGRGGWEIMGVTMTMPVGAKGYVVHVESTKLELMGRSTIVNSTLISTTDLVLNKDFDFSDSGWAARQTPGNCEAPILPITYCLPATSTCWSHTDIQRPIPRPTLPPPTRPTPFPYQATPPSSSSTAPSRRSTHATLSRFSQRTTSRSPRVNDTRNTVPSHPGRNQSGYCTMRASSPGRITGSKWN